MVNCSVRGCKNYSSRKNQKVVRYYGFPNDKKLQKQWLNVCDLSSKKEFVNNYRVCSDHFTQEDYILKDLLLNTPLEKRKLKKEAVPSVNVPKPLIISNRMKIREKRHMKQLVDEFVRGCESRSDKLKLQNINIKFHRFPKDSKICKIWLDACDKRNVNPLNARICSLHFSDEMYVLKHRLLNIPIEKRNLNLNAIPTEYLPKQFTHWSIDDEVKRKKFIEELLSQAEQKKLSNAEKKEKEKNNENDEIQVKEPVFETVSISLIPEEKITKKLNVQDDEHQPEELIQLMDLDESEEHDYPTVVHNYSEGHNYPIVHNYSEEHNYSEKPYHVEEYIHFGKHGHSEKHKHSKKLDHFEKQTHFEKQNHFEKQDHFKKQDHFEKQDHFKKQNYSVEHDLPKQDMTIAVLVDTEVQTQGELNCIALLEVYELRRKLNAANREIKKQENEIMKLKESEYQLDARLKRIFTLKQIEKLKNSPYRTKWTYDDLTSAMRLYVLGPRSYKYLLDKNYPLPSVKTLKRLNHIVKNYKNSLDNSVKNHFCKDLEIFSKFNEQINS